MVRRGTQIPRGNYKISQLELIETQFNFIFYYKTINLKIDLCFHRVEINPKTIAIACNAKRSIIQVFGLGTQFFVQTPLGKQNFKFMIFGFIKYIQAKLFLSINRISNMYMYLDIV